MAKGHFGAVAARPGKLKLSVEAMSSPRQVGLFTMKLFGGPGEPEACLGELGSRKLCKKTFLPLFFGIFCIPDQNIKRSFVLCGNWRRTTQFG